MNLSPTTPEFLDAERLSVKVGALYKAIKASENVHYGVEALPRHLRRRATSHNSYRQRRRPRQLPIPLHPDTQQDFDGGEGEGLYQVKFPGARGYHTEAIEIFSTCPGTPHSRDGPIQY